MEAMIIIMKKKNIIAKQAIGYDSEYMFRTMKDIPMCCPFCRSRQDVIPDLNYIMRKRKGDMYYTYITMHLYAVKHIRTKTLIFHLMTLFLVQPLHMAAMRQEA